MIEKWTKWIPFPTAQGLYVLENMEGSLWDIDLHFAAIDAPFSKLKIRFEFVLIAYRSTHRTYREKSLLALQSQLGNTAINWSFFIVENSDYSSWISQQSCAIRLPEEFTHYVFITPDVIIDVASWGNPDNPLITQE